jgi:predicted RND superfamily exporter protein
MKRFSRYIIRFRWPVIIIVTGLTLFFGYKSGSLRINSDIISSLPDDDPVAKMYKNTLFNGWMVKGLNG